MVARGRPLLVSPLGTPAKLKSISEILPFQRYYCSVLGDTVREVSLVYFCVDILFRDIKYTNTVYCTLTKMVC